MALISGTNASEIIDATDGVTNDGDTIFGLGGSDTIYGLGGNDFLKGGGGADTLYGGAGSDTAGYGDSFAGVVISLASHVASGGDAEGDVLNSIENVVGSNYADQLWGDEGANSLTGLNGNDVLKGFGGQDSLSGGEGDDNLYGGTDIDTMTGGNGNDDYWVDNAGDIIVETANAGFDRVYTSTSYKLAAGVSVETLQTTDSSATTAIDLTGNAISNTLYGNAGHNVLDGGGAIDTMSGLGGDDWYVVDNLKDVVIEGVGQGTLDRVFASTTYVLTAGAEAEKLSTTDHQGLDPVGLFGNEFANEIFGNAGSNAIGGREGNDVLTGMGGADRFFFDTTLNPVTNVDVITDFDVADDMIYLPHYTAIFNNLGAGNLDPAYFHVGAAAADSDDRLIYNDVTGWLSYDADADGNDLAVHFATLSPGLALSAADFYLY